MSDFSTLSVAHFLSSLSFFFPHPKQKLVVTSSFYKFLQRSCCISLFSTTRPVLEYSLYLSSIVEEGSLLAVSNLPNGVFIFLFCHEEGLREERRGDKGEKKNETTLLNYGRKKRSYLLMYMCTLPFSLRSLYLKMSLIHGCGVFSSFSLSLSFCHTFNLSFLSRPSIHPWHGFRCPFIAHHLPSLCKKENSITVQSLCVPLPLSLFRVFFQVFTYYLSCLTCRYL